MSAQPDLLSWTPPPVDRCGDSYVCDFDYGRLNGQELRVFLVMKTGAWLTLREIENITGDPQASISARLRDLQNIHKLKKERRRRFEGGGTWEYRIDPASIPRTA